MNRSPADTHEGAHAAPAVGGAPAAAPRLAATVLGLQRSAGNRAVGRIVGTGAVLARSPAADASSASVSASPSATAEDFRVAIGLHVDDLSRQVAMVKQLKSANWGLPQQLEWHVDQLSWITEATGRAAQLVREAEVGDDWSPRKFAQAGTYLTGAIFGLKALAIVLAYDDLYYEVQMQYPGVTARPRNGAELVHESLGPILSQLNSPVPELVDPAVEKLYSEGPGWWSDFSARKDDTESDIQAHMRFLGWLNIVMLAWTAFDIWMLPVVGPHGGGTAEPPRIGGIGGMGGGGGAAVATAGTVLTTEASLAALRRLAAVGAITAPKLVEFVRGRTGEIAARPKPIEASVKDGGAGGGASAPTPRATKGLPTPAEDVVLRRYSKGLAKLRETLETYKRMTLKSVAGAKEVDRARAAYEAAQRALDEIENEALAKAESDLAGHLDPLVEARRMLETQGLDATVAGRRVPCDAVRLVPKNLRGMDFADLEKAIGRPPDEVRPASARPGAGMPTGGQRLRWEFKDGSELVVDDPRDLGRVHKTADLPHAELHGPAGERLDPEGIEVPDASASAHMTVTDRLGRLRDQFARARKGL